MATHSTSRDLIGEPLEELDTPALLLDHGACRRNLKRMASYFAERPAKLRPHFKNHKCVTLARLQLAEGAAVGMTCAKLSEAEILADGGFDDILIANQIAGRRKAGRLARLAQRCRLAVAVDARTQIDELQTAAAALGATLGVFVEVDIGMGRCGVDPGQPALELAQATEAASHLEFRGIQAFEGHLVYLNDVEERTARTRAAMALAVETRQFIEEHGISVPCVSGGSTSTYTTSGNIAGVDEIQAGTYATMDWRYGELVPEFEVALSLLTRVISAHGSRAVLDVGVKGAGGEFGLPKIRGLPEVKIPFFLAEEHLVLHEVPHLAVGTALQLLSSHACTTCNLHREFVVHEDGIVVDIWPIEAAGRMT